MSNEEIQRHLRLAGEALGAAEVLSAQQSMLRARIDVWRDEQRLLAEQAVQLEEQAVAEAIRAEGLTIAAQQQQRLADIARAEADAYREQSAEYLANRSNGLIGWLTNWWYEWQASRADAMVEQALAEVAQRDAEAADLLVQSEVGRHEAASLQQQAVSARQQARQLAQSINEQAVVLQELQDDIDHQLALAIYHQQQAGIPSQREQTIHFAYSLTGELLGEYGEDGKPIREYIHANGAPLAMFHYTIQEGGEDDALHAEVYWYHTDHLGTPQALTNRAGQVVWQAQYDPFGEVVLTVSQVTQPLRFPGQYFDGETGLHYNYFRDYDPGLGRYIQSDPIGLAGGMNTFSYVSGNPINDFDPMGLNQMNRSPYAPGGSKYKNPQGDKSAKCRSECFGTLNPPLPSWAAATASTFGSHAVRRSSPAASSALRGLGGAAGAWAAGTGVGCVIICDHDCEAY